MACQCMLQVATTLSMDLSMSVNGDDAIPALWKMPEYAKHGRTAAFGGMLQYRSRTTWSLTQRNDQRMPRNDLDPDLRE